MRLILIAILGLTLANSAYSAWPWRKAAQKTGIELNAVKVGIAEQADALAKVNVEVGANAKSLADIKAQVGDIEAKLNAQVSAVAGFNNKVSNLASGRDTIQTTTNDSDLLKFIFDKWEAVIAGLFAFILSLMGGVWMIVKYISGMYDQQLREKDARIERESTSRAAKEEKLDRWQESMITKLTLGYDTEGKREVERLLAEADKDSTAGR